MYLEVTGSRLESSNPKLFCSGAGGPGDQSQEVTVTLLRSRVVAEYQQLLGPNTQPGHPACIQYPPGWWTPETVQSIMEKNTVHLRGRGEYTGNIEVGFKSKVESLMLISVYS